MMPIFPNNLCQTHIFFFYLQNINTFDSFERKVNFDTEARDLVAYLKDTAISSHGSNMTITFSKDFNKPLNLTVQVLGKYR